MNTAKIREKIAFAVLGFATLLTVAPILLTILYIVKNGASGINWSFIAEAPRNGMKEGGILPAIIGTIVLIIGTITLGWCGCTTMGK